MEALKNRRAYRRGQVTKIHNRLLAIRGQPLKDAKKTLLKQLQSDLDKELDTYSQIQGQIEELLIETPDLLQVEQEAEERFNSLHQEVEALVLSLLTAHKVFEDYTSLAFELEVFKEYTDLTVPGVRQQFDNFREKVHQLVKDSVDVMDDPRVTGIINEVKDVTKTLSLTFNKGTSTSSTETSSEDTLSVTDHSHSYAEHGSRLNLELPTFDGEPRHWHTFKEMFTATMETRGRHLKDIEKRCLLLKAMATDEARAFVQRNSQGSDSYQTALDALALRYGSPQIVYPLLVREITDNHEVFEYDREGLQHLQDRYVLTYDSIVELVGDSLSPFLVQHARQFFSPKLREEWDRNMAGAESMPTIDDLRTYIAGIIYQMEPRSRASHDSRSDASRACAPGRTAPKPALSSTPRCPLCGDKHLLFRCQAFRSKDPEERERIVRDKRLCTNCLSDGHFSRNCPSKRQCKTCQQRHHSLLHRTSVSTDGASALAVKASSTTAPLPHEQPPVLCFVDTALVNATNGHKTYQARAALDSGSGISLITESLASRLGLRRHGQRVQYEGLHGQGSSRAYAKVELCSLRDPEKRISVTVSIVPKLQAVRPPRNRQAILDDPAVKDFELADPQLGGPLDLLIGALDRCECLTGGIVQHPDLHLAITKTIFGWTITGPLGGGKSPTPVFQTQPQEDPLQHAFERLWEMDRVPEAPASSEDNHVVKHFLDTHTRDQQGRYVVRLPRIEPTPDLGHSRSRAIRRYVSNERSLQTRGQLAAFVDVLQEYLSLGHAEVVPRAEITKPSYYLPVHGVFKSSSSTTKVRAVFDASAPSSNGVSLNDLLEVGPNLYPLLSDVLIRFRSYRIGLTADIGKMFREVALHEDEKNLHRFLLRGEDGELKDCRMKRLTFGVRPSPFLATQVIQHLAKHHDSTHPEASQTILRDFYVDDCLSGADTIDEAVTLQRQLCDLLGQAGMTLRKWRSNSPEVLGAIPDGLKESGNLHIAIATDAPKALGVHWDVSTDKLHISTPIEVETSNVTKRTIASDTSRVFDILGLMAPAILPARLLLQSLWKQQLTWDEPVPTDVKEQWTAWCQQLRHITNCAIPRRMTSHDSPVRFKALHGFSDASTLAYGAAIYLRTVHDDGHTSITLITAKARVMPVKPTTIPRAELVAALLMAKLLTHTASILNISTQDLYCWTDSTIVLHWLGKSPSQLKTYVANRVAAIQNLLPSTHWRHVATHENPADLLSRGAEASSLVENELWWKGPPWLQLGPAEWSTKPLPGQNVTPELKVSCLSTIADTPSQPFWGKFSSFAKASRVTAWCLRFCHNSRSPPQARTMDSVLTSTEVAMSKTRLFAISQQDAFPEVIDAVKANKPLPRGHPLRGMILRLDSDHLISATGRIRDSASPKNPKTLLVLSLKSDIVRMFVNSAHRQHGHPGTEALMSIINDGHYIPGLRNFIKKICRTCVTCQKALARPLICQMGMLPLHRTTPAPPFAVTGLDFAGPFQVKLGHTRKPTYRKIYACLFVCLTTRAIHLDVCADLSTSEFVATFRRFTARRGTPSHVYSDNGTNFVGTKAEIKELQQLTTSEQTKSAVSHLSTDTGLTWHLIPPRAPHFGGLWEAGVKSMKTLLRKLVTPHPLRQDELYTLLTEIEAILNSRPLSPLLSQDGIEDSALTPGHFLIGRPLKAPPLKSAGSGNINHLRRWSLIQRLTRDLWQKWLGRYLQSRFHRAKWLKTTHPLHIGDVVLVKDVTLKYRDWPLARVVKTYPGDDGTVRAVDVLCHGNIYTRPSHMMVPLLQEDDTNSLSKPPDDGPTDRHREPRRMFRTHLHRELPHSPDEDVQATESLTPQSAGN